MITAFYIVSIVTIFVRAESRVETELGSDLFLTQSSRTFHVGHLKTSLILDDQNYKVDISVGGNFSRSFSEFYYAKELYYSWQMSFQDNATLWTVGRRKYNWSNLDSIWGQGITQPLWRWYPTLPEEQGFVGSFFEINSSKNKVILFLSPLFIPTQGPSFNRYNGNLISGNPWFDRPVDIIEVNGNDVPINYDISMPKMADVLLNYSAGLIWEISPSTKHNFRFSYLNKPKNDLVFLIDGVITPQPLAVIQVYPELARHQVASADWLYRITPSLSLGVSGLYEYGVQFRFPSHLTGPIFRDNVLAQFDLTQVNESSKWGIAMINTQAKSTDSVGALATSQGSLFAYRYNFTQATKLFWSKSWLDNHDLSTQFSIIHSWATYATNLSFRLDYRLEENWHIYFMGEIFGKKSTTKSVSDLLARYSNHDHAFMGVKYVF